MNVKSLLFSAVVLSLGGLVWGAEPQAVLTQIKGKVEVKAPGTKAWVPATEGQVLDQAATLSTGFDASVVVVMDKNTLQVKPLTRITIDKLVEEAGVVKTSTFLRVGSVSASVKSAEGVKQEFKVQSPYSTASVRGTQFNYDGVSLQVTEGQVGLTLGRPQRPVGDGDPASQQTTEDDFVGAPDVPESEQVLVDLGQEARVLIDFTNPGTVRTEGSDDPREAPAVGGAPVTAPKVVTTGGLELTITFAE